MKLRSILGVCALMTVFMLASVSYAQDYAVGSEGIKAGTVPGPGFYYLMYNQIYSSDTLNDENGDEIDNGFDLHTFANVHRFVWMTGKKFLGADYGMNVIVPLVSVDIDIDAAGISENSFDVGDITLEPVTLAWHGARYDGALGLALVLPTGYYDEGDASSVGKDHYTFMLTTGGTLYADEAKLWSFSILTRYEKHFDNRDKDIRYGDDFSFDWGIGRQIGLYNVGVSGYAHWQISDDEGDDVTSEVKDHIMGIGPEVQIDVPPMKGQVRFKYYKEFDAVDTNEGDAFWITLVKAF